MKKALINNVINVEKREQKALLNVLLVLSGAIFLALMAQLKIVLPFTPVPVTGGTFAVMLLGLLYGKKLAPATVLTYAGAGVLGAPVFAGFKAFNIFMAPTGGYVIGYIVAALICGYFADKGFTTSYRKTILVLLIANIAVYTFGLVQLSFFVGSQNVLATGLVPFILGDIIKMTLVTLLVSSASKFIKK